MVSELAKGDFLKLQAQGLSPTLEDFDRLNQLALRLKDGPETTAANFPRVGWAGDVPFFEPTIQAFAWYHGYAVRFAQNAETEDTFWAYALAHARERGAFEKLRTPVEIEAAVREWAETLPVTHGEVLRACRYAARGFDDADPAKPDSAGNPRHRADVSAAAKNLAEVEKILAKACAALHVTPDEIMHETPSRLDRLCEEADAELGRKVTRDEAQLRADYDLTRREIVRRLKAEKAKKDADGDSSRGDAKTRREGQSNG